MLLGETGVLRTSPPSHIVQPTTLPRAGTSTIYATLRAHIPNDEPRLVKRMIELAPQYGCYGYCLVTRMLCEEGRRVNHKRIECLWRQEDLWFNDSSRIRLRLPKRNSWVRYKYSSRPAGGR